MPILLPVLAAIGAASTGFLVLGSGIRETGNAAENAGNKLVTLAVAGLAIFAAYKFVVKK